MNKNIIGKLFLTLVLLFMAKWQPSLFSLNYVFFFQAFRWCKPDFCGSIIAYSQKSIQGNTVFLLSWHLFRTLLSCLSFFILLTNQVAIEPVFLSISSATILVKVIAIIYVLGLRVCSFVWEYGFCVIFKRKTSQENCFSCLTVKVCFGASAWSLML